MKAAILSDIHCNFVSEKTIELLCDRIAFSADIIIISGDIAEAPTLDKWLSFIEYHSGKPVLFCCGNHDFYFSSIKAVRKSLLNSNHQWLQGTGPIELTPKTVLIGVDCWYDAGYGNYNLYGFNMPDFDFIAELKTKNRDTLYDKLKYLGDESYLLIKELIPKVEKYENIIFVCHPPPFAEASYYGVNRSSAHTLPYFSCKGAGDALLDMKDECPNSNIDVYCGHTHSAAELHIDNLHVYVAEAHYGDPDISRIIEII